MPSPREVLEAILNMVEVSTNLQVDRDYWVKNAVAWRLWEEPRKKNTPPDKMGCIVSRDNLALCVKLCYNQFKQEYHKVAYVSSSDIVDCNCR